MLRRFGYGFIGLEIVTSAILLGLAWLSPIMSVKTWIFFYEEVTIMEAATRLYRDGFLFLALLVFVFAVVFPALKLLVLGRAWYLAAGSLGGANIDGVLKVFDHMGKWSMLDVFIVAVIVVSTQSSMVADAQLHPGLYLFAASILISMSAMFDLRSYRKKGVV